MYPGDTKILNNRDFIAYHLVRERLGYSDTATHHGGQADVL
jgi:hypothetical protein